MVAKKKPLSFIIFFVALVLASGLLSQETYASYSSNTVSSGDMKLVYDYFGLNYYPATLNASANAMNQLLTDQSLDLLNVCFTTLSGSIVVIPVNGSVGNNNQNLYVFQNGNAVYVRKFDSWTYSGDTINGANYSGLTIYWLSGNTYTTSNNATSVNFTNYSGTIISSNSQPNVDISTVLATWGYCSVASSINNEIGSYNWRFLSNKVQFSNWVTPTPTPTSTPSPTPTPSNGGNTDLSTTNDKIDEVKDSVNNVNNSIDNLSSQISGETQEIVDTLTSVPDLSGETVESGEIIDALNFNFSGDPYENFWLTLTNGLYDCLTYDQRTINFTFLNHTYLIDLDETLPHYPESIEALLTIICIYYFCFLILKYIKHMMHLIQSGNMDTLLEMNEETGIIDIF